MQNGTLQYIWFGRRMQRNRTPMLSWCWSYFEVIATGVLRSVASYMWSVMVCYKGMWGNNTAVEIILATCITFFFYHYSCWSYFPARKIKKDGVYNLAS